MEAALINLGQFCLNYQIPKERLVSLPYEPERVTTEKSIPLTQPVQLTTSGKGGLLIQARPVLWGQIPETEGVLEPLTPQSKHHFCEPVALLDFCWQDARFEGQVRHVASGVLTRNAQLELGRHTKDILHWGEVRDLINSAPNIANHHAKFILTLDTKGLVLKVVALEPILVRKPADPTEHFYNPYHLKEVGKSIDSNTTSALPVQIYLLIFHRLVEIYYAKYTTTDVAWHILKPQEKQGMEAVKALDRESLQTTGSFTLRHNRFGQLIVGSQDPKVAVEVLIPNLP